MATLCKGRDNIGGADARRRLRIAGQYGATWGSEGGLATEGVHANYQHRRWSDITRRKPYGTPLQRPSKTPMSIH